MEVKEWIEKLKSDSPELRDFVLRLESYISETGLNVAKFEAAVSTGLKKAEESINTNPTDTHA